jgi:hypothetical protein
MKVRKSSPKKENKKPEKKSAKQTQKTEALKAEEKKSETDLISQLTDFVSNIKKSDPESFTE